MSTLSEMLYNNNVRFRVGQQITCPRTGNILDFRTCVVLLDEDDFPSVVMSPEGWLDMIATDPEAETKLANLRLHVNPDTVPQEES